MTLALIPHSNPPADIEVNLAINPDPPGYVGKIGELYKYFPKPAYVLIPGSGKGISVVLDVAGGELNTAVEDIASARDQFFLATAEGSFLDAIGVNINIPRPSGFSDESYRELQEIITYSSKNVERIFERILTLFFGPNTINQSTVIQTGNTNGSVSVPTYTISGLSSVVGIFAGFPVSGPGIPVGSVIETVGSTSVTISQPITIAQTGATFTFAINQQYSWIANAYSVIPNQITVSISQAALILIAQRSLYGSWFIHAGISNVTYTGNATDGSFDLTGMSSISGIIAGMEISGSGIVPGTTVVSASGTTVVMSEKANLTSEGIYFNFEMSPLNFYDSGYIYDNVFGMVIEASVIPGGTSIVPLPLPLEVGLKEFGTYGVAYIDAQGPSFEALAYYNDGEKLNFDTPLTFEHLSGSPLTRASLGTEIMTTLTAAVTVSTPVADLEVNDGTNFPPQPFGVTWSTYAIKLDAGLSNEEVVPLIGVDPSNANHLLIDSNYSFRYSHSIGGKVQLMSLQSQVSTDGLDWPIYFTDNSGLINQLITILSRIKAIGFQIKIINSGNVFEDNLITESGEILITEDSDEIII